MNPKTKVITVFASTSLAVLLAALFVPLFCGFALWCFVTTSIWQLSPLFALLCAVGSSAFILMPVVRPSARSWLYPFVFGLTLVVSALYAAFYSFPVATDLSNLVFHPYGLILFAVGGLLCAAEGYMAKSSACHSTDAA